jgi:hypothetical protein
LNKNKFDAQLNYLDQLIQLRKSGVNVLGPNDMVIDRISNVINAIEETMSEK